MHKKLIANQINIAWPCASNTFPATIGMVSPLIAKHWEKIAIEIPWYSIGGILITASVAVGRNAANPIEMGIWAKNAKYMPRSQILDNPNSKQPNPKLYKLIDSPNFGL